MFDWFDKRFVFVAVSEVRALEEDMVSMLGALSSNFSVTLYRRKKKLTFVPRKPFE
jgi:hypothetical protein